MYHNDHVDEKSDKSQLAMSPLLSHEERMDILLERTDVTTSLSWSSPTRSSVLFKDNKTVVSYEYMLSKAGEKVNNENNVVNNDFNVVPPEDVFVNKAGEHIIHCEKKWFKKKQNALEAQLTLTERRVIRGLKQSLRRSRDKIQKEYNASMFQ